MRPCGFASRHRPTMLLAARQPHFSCGSGVYAGNHPVSRPELHRLRARSVSNDLRRPTFTARLDLQRPRLVGRSIRGGTWQLCSDAYFRGQCVTLNRASIRRSARWASTTACRRCARSAGTPAVAAAVPAAAGAGRGRRLDRPLRVARQLRPRVHAQRADRPTSTAPASTIAPVGARQLAAPGSCAPTPISRAPARSAARAAIDNLGGVTGRVSSARPIAGGGGPAPAAAAAGAAAAGAVARASCSTRAQFLGPRLYGDRHDVLHQSRPAPASTTARRRCASSAATGCSAPMPTSRRVPHVRSRRLSEPADGSPTGSLGPPHLQRLPVQRAAALAAVTP